jgi:hypothetical protein
MTTKEARKALKAGEKIIFNRHISGSSNFERIPVLAVKEVHGVTVVKFNSSWNRQTKPVWVAVQTHFDDYLSVQFPPIVPVTFETVAAQDPDSVDAREAREFRRLL